jgi:hypothetical protein
MVKYLYLSSLVFYNYSNSLFRIIILLFLLLYPIAKILTHKNYWVVPNEIRHLSFFYLCWLLTVLVSLFINISTFDFALSGPAVEMLTPIVFGWIILSWYVTLNFVKHKNGINKKIQISNSLYFIVFIAIFDVAVRYLQEPDCFLNYLCRFEAKTVGLFSTSNATGLSIMFVLVLLRVIGGYVKFEILLSIILLTTMARASIIAYLICLTFIVFFKANIRWKLTLGFPLVLAIILNLIYDPLELANDGSANSKADFFKAAYTLIENGSFGEILFGFGASFSTITLKLNVNDWSPHVPILKSFMYYGFIGVWFYLLSLILIVSKFRMLFWPTVGYFISGLAGAPIVFLAYAWAIWVLKVSYD